MNISDIASGAQSTATITDSVKQQDLGRDAFFAIAYRSASKSRSYGAGKKRRFCGAIVSV